MNQTVLYLAVISIFFVSAEVGAVCIKDIECSSDLVCIDGMCQRPPAPSPPPVVTIVPKAPQAPPPAPAPAPTPAPVVERNVCANVPCSGRGTCVVKGGEPACSCNEGYQPDQATGLSCIPLETQKPATSTTSLSTADPELLAVESALGRTRYHHFETYKRSANINTRMSYAEYEMRLARSKRGSGIATLFCSTILAGFGVGMYVLIIDQVGYLYLPAAATILALSLSASTAMIIVGAVKWGKYAKWMRRLKPLTLKTSNGLRFEGVSPVLSRNGTPKGAALTFSF